METFEEIIFGIEQTIYIIIKYIADALSAAALWIGNYFNEHILPSMPTMLKFFSNKKMNMVLFCAVAAYILCINTRAVFLLSGDKIKTQRKEKRLAEKRLMNTCLWGGAMGGCIGMHVYHHKATKFRFTVIMPILSVIQLIVDSFALGFLGFWAFF
ncbi:MAG TPA: DUF1294 domain-containing protein [Candidatus Ornithomonoglobus intestinigallinarum]|uniref:DUF1294 domain-containing protein n=1 Tax=Candidatus Ornithomonoglobus intestinigallinarum TaxID=2840894 RepID=A0A9D1KQE0_9FIRM|nr:DUF1294 domain-containing protein [Candidatus Ornithomonoglobus intestinigallinarum]